MLIISSKKKYLLFIILIFFITSCHKTTEFHVSITGNDSNIGSLEKPFASIEAARNAIRDKGNGGEIIIHKGVYRFSKPLKLLPIDSKVIYRAAKGEKVVITGAKKLNLKWDLWKNGIYKANLNLGYAIDQLFVNGERQHMARYPNYEESILDPISDDKSKHRVPYFNGFNSKAWSKEKVANWKNPIGAYMHAMRKGLWGSVHYEVIGKKEDSTLLFEGGMQHNRVGSKNMSILHDEAKMIENVFEELDAPKEWFFNQKTNTLYYMPPNDLDVMSNPTIEIVSNIRHLVEIYGNTKKPIENITIEGGNSAHVKIDLPEVTTAVCNVTFKGITFTGTARTFMETKEALLRSDWNIYRGGAIHIRGGEDILIKDCEFNQVGGNAVFVDAYNKRVTVKSCVFKKSGATDVNFVGSLASVRSPMYKYGVPPIKISEFDTIKGPKTDDYPVDCLVEDCIMTQCGRFEKQNSGVNIATSARITVRHNSIFMVPRAAINICNGNWGGHVIEWNDCFNTVLETSDHGAFNSWGRDRYWWPCGVNGPTNKDDDGTTSIEKFLKQYPDMMLWDVIEQNILRNNRMHCLNGWGIDLDDGSTNYEIYNNICLGGGLKTREGYYRKVYNNIIFKNFTCNVPYPAPVNDEFYSNIIIGDHYHQTIPGLWKGSRDNTLFHNPEIKNPIPATSVQLYSMDDKNSIVANAKFIDPVKGDFTVASDSPALNLGFNNFPMTGFGVTSEKYKKMIPELQFKLPKTYFSNSFDDPVFRLKILGAMFETLNNESQVTAYGSNGIGGAIISKLPEHSKLKDFGFKLDDVILEIENKKVSTAKVLSFYIKKFLKPGNTYQIKILRNQAEMILNFEYK